MKIHRLIGLATVLTSCASTEPAAPQPSRAQHHRESVARSEEEGSRPPRIGMTKDQVLNMYGEPTNISTSTRGEIWAYVFNNFDGRSFIPYYGPIHQAYKRRNSGTVIFDGSGRVRDFNWNHTNPKAATIWR